MKKESKTCCFFGHRKITGAEELRKRLYNILEELIVYSHVDTFLFGSKSDFDNLCREVVAELREKHPHIRRVYVRAEYPEINDDYERYLLKSYEETYFPKCAVHAGKAVCVERNREMIDHADYCIAYCKDNYAAPIRKNSQRDLTAYQPKSGTKIAYEYAEHKKKKIINVAE